MLRLFFLLLLLINLLCTARLFVAASDAVQPGEDNNSCFDDTRWLVVKKKACEKAAKEQEGVKKFFGTENNAFRPTGCYFCKKRVSGSCEKGTWWNAHDAGTAKKQTKRLCALPDWKFCKKGGCEEPTDDDDDDDDDDDNTDDDTTITTLFVGDSDIELWKKTDTLYPPSKNVGVSGWTAKKVEKNIKKFLADDPPTAWVVLVCGENDFADGESVGKTFKYFKKIVKEVLKTTEGVRVLYLGTKPEPGTTDLHQDYRKYDKKIRDHAKKLSDDRNDDTLVPPLVMIDTYPQFIEIGNPDTLYKDDELHLSKEGYAYWNDWTTYVFNNADTQCQVYQNNVCTQE